MAGHPDLREFSPEVERITKALGDTTLALPTGQGLWWPCEGPHWEHIYDAGCAICKAGSAPYALRLVIERVLELATEIVLDLHKPTDYAFDTSGATTEDDAPFCAVCQEYDEMQDEWRPAAWPCATAQALGVTE